MKNVGIVFGSTTGMCEDLAGVIASKIGGEVINITDVTRAQIDSFDLLLLGSSTWGCGELQPDWRAGMSVVKRSNLKGKPVGIFGCGDTLLYGDTFCDAMGIIYDELSGSGCLFVGQTPTDGYSYDSSMAEREGMLIGLATDELHESDMTAERLDAWIAKIESQL